MSIDLGLIWMRSMSEEKTNSIWDIRTKKRQLTIITKDFEF